MNKKLLAQAAAWTAGALQSLIATGIITPKWAPFVTPVSLGLTALSVHLASSTSVAHPNG